MRKIIFIFFYITLIQYVSGQQPLSPSAIEIEITDWEFKMVGDSLWKKAKVPGTIIDNFVDLTDITNPLHPYYGDNEKLFQWIGEKEWEFRTTILIDKSYLNSDYDLEFKSLDLFADVYINGVKWVHENAFSPLVIHYGFLKEQIDLRIVFHSTINTLFSLAQNDSIKLPGGERVYGRKPPYEFGWDWAPRFINMGIRQPIKLWIYPKGITYFDVEVFKWDVNDLTARFGLITSIYDPHKEFDLHSNVLFKGTIVEQFKTPVSISFNNIDTTFIVIHDPKLWWPNGVGRNAGDYYEFDFRLTLAGDTSTIAQQTFDFAICHIQLMQEKDEKGEAFYFLVNDEKVYAKGANYVPDDSFKPGKNTIELVKMAANANMNMIRVWGGGTYPDENFYEECMKNGIMVWQDYMFACGMYPGNEAFLDLVSYEARYQTERISQYNNVALWCGNNENEEGWKNWGWQRELNMSSKDSAMIWTNYVELFQNQLKRNSEAELKSYISTSPKYGWGRKESMTEGDSHYWGVWWGLEPIEKYNDKVPRFMSEFGMQGMPDLSTLKKVLPDSAMNFLSPKFKNHQKHPTGFETLDHYLQEYLIIPDNLEDYAYATQVLQAYALTTAIEAQRRAMPYCMGSLIWQLNDCWPVTSWSLIDYELKEKIAYHEVAEKFAKIILSIKEDDKGYHVFIINEDTQFKKFDLRIEIKDFYGNPIWKKSLNVTSENNSSTDVYHISKKKLAKIDLTTVYLYCDIRTADKVLVRPTITSTFYHFVKPNQLNLPKPDFTFYMQDSSIWIKNNVYCPYFSIPGNEEFDEIYVGALAPGTFPCYFLNKSDEKQFNYLQQTIPKIKCLNTLLNK